MVVAGFACVDFSNLNNHQRTIDEAGESSDTLNAIIRYAEVSRVPLLILENIKSCPWEKVTKKWEKIGYTAYDVPVDSKDYYIPHTRQRGYMLCINRSPMRATMGRYAAEKWADNICLDWEILMWAFEKKASAPFTSFLLQPDDVRLDRSTQELTKAHADDPTTREINWSKCQQRHLTYRQSHELGNRRPVTEWQENGPSNMVDFGNLDWSRAQPERVKDTMDIAYLRNAREKQFDHDYKP